MKEYIKTVGGHKKLVDKEVMTYFKVNDKIHIIDGILLKNDQGLISFLLDNMHWIIITKVTWESKYSETLILLAKYE